MPLTVEYDPFLIILSIAVAVVGCFGGLRATRQVNSVPPLFRKVVFAFAALAIGTSIWSMHFIGMLAVSIPVLIEYNVLVTLISALVSILMTGIGLAFAVYGKRRLRDICAGGLLMGLGISCMHYIGMAAIQANCVVAYDPTILIVSVLVGVAASTLAIALLSQPRQKWNTALAALTMGLAISGMHYTAMASASFLPLDVLAENAQPIMQSSTLAFGVAFSTFFIVGFAVLSALPSAMQGKPQAQASVAGSGAPRPPGAATTPTQSHGLPVELNKRQLLLDPSEIIAVKAEGHYTVVFGEGDRYFCDISISKVHKLLDPERFLRVHRSYIVNLKGIKSFQRRGEQGLLGLSTRDDMAVPVSRANVGRLREILEI